METNFNFKSQPATSIEQSIKLLALGLKKETADMCLQSTLNDVWSPYIPIAMPYSKVEAFDLSKDVFRIIPAWSLHRLIEMMPEYVTPDDWLGVSFDDVSYYHGEGEGIIGWKYYKAGNVYDCMIECYEWLIKEGYFNKEYLEE